MSNKKRRTIFVFGSFFCGALLLCFFSTFQKKAIGAPIVIRGYFVPFVFGGISGGIIGFYISKIKEYNSVLQERVNSKHTRKLFANLLELQKNKKTKF